MTGTANGVPQRAFWDGRVDGGRAAATGVYLAVVEDGGQPVVGRTFLVR